VTLTPITESDVTFTNPLDGRGFCDIQVIDAVIEYLGYGNPSSVLDETFDTTLTSLESIYESELEANVALYCSAE
jgi:hypothetical protein